LIKGPKISSRESASSGSMKTQGVSQGSAKSLSIFLIQAPPVLVQTGEGARGDDDAGFQGADNCCVELGVQSVVNVGADIDLHMITSEHEEGVVEDSMEEEVGEESSQADSMDTTKLEMALKEWGEEEESSKLPSVEEMVAIPEVWSEQSADRRSKCQVGEVDEEVGVTDEHRKALRNEGNSIKPAPSFPITNSMVISNLNAIGVCLGDNDDSVCKSLINIREKTLGSLQEHVPISLKDEVLEKEGKELEEEKLEKLFLTNICSEIIEELMDLKSDCDVVLPRGYNKKKSFKKGKKHKKT
jgi:hypothetical protein